ncbi:hypothetical protein E3N88_36269 [Mikania micrantha]|uniref:1-phosphatidylinositol 4-kinase n=1 Tax=Mikania micrantha TaxID=192012 RepID=A0A5N6M397_9ASTR|nr:hypothetical protein E3N88_36269 [Mikania micrantha]
MPFSELEIDYISNLDPFRDAEVIRTELPLIRECAVRVFILCTIFLKWATAAGLFLADIGQMMTRDFIRGEESWSVLENICVDTKANLDMEITSDVNNEIKEFDEMFAFEEDFEDGLNPNEGVCVCVSFEEMKEDRWSSFLEYYMELLPEAFEDKKITSLLKQRLRNS